MKTFLFSQAALYYLCREAWPGLPAAGWLWEHCSDTEMNVTTYPASTPDPFKADAEGLPEQEEDAAPC